MQALNFLSPPAPADAVTPLPVSGKHKNVSVPGQYWNQAICAAALIQLDD